MYTIDQHTWVKCGLNVEEEFRSQNGLNAPLTLTGIRIKTLADSLTLRYRGLALSVCVASRREAMPKALPLVHEVSPIGEEKALRCAIRHCTEFMLLAVAGRLAHSDS
jgi:hypothetical protein